MATAKKSTTSKIGAPATKTATQKISPVEAPKAAKAAAPAPAAKPVSAFAATQPIKPIAAPAPVAKPVAVPAAAQPVKAPATAISKSVSQSEWRGMVEQAAYFIAEKNGFSGDAELHWAEAEKQVRTDLTRKGVKVV